jgi:hypothetical protein
LQPRKICAKPSKPDIYAGSEIDPRRSPEKKEIKMIIIQSLHKDIQHLDLNYRPETFWGIPEALLANVKGERRKQLIKEALQNSETIPEYVFESDWPLEMKQSLMAQHPSLSGGEYLPDYLPGEVEFARISMPYTTLADVISLRVRFKKDRFYYRCIDEYWDQGFSYNTYPKTTKHPLTLAGLINMILSIECGEDLREGDDLVYSLYEQWYVEYYEEKYHPPLRITSEFYPGLGDYFIALQDSFQRTVTSNDAENLTNYDLYERALVGFELPRVRSHVNLQNGKENKNAKTRL